MSIIIEPIPFFQTNYAWLVYDSIAKQAIVVDPGNATPVIQYLHEKDLALQSIVITHFHNDHIGGIQDLKKQFNPIVIAPLIEKNKIPCIDQTVRDNDIVDLSLLKAYVIETPGHTLGSVCYYMPLIKAVFTGDTLFSMGCGRLFEGTAEQMYQSLKKIQKLPDDVFVYCAHEYTEDNARFALTVDPDNHKLRYRIKEVEQLRHQEKPTLPVLLSVEKQTNPFLLAKNNADFAKLRELKDQF